MIRTIAGAITALLIFVATPAKAQFFWDLHGGHAWLKAETPGIPDVKGKGGFGGIGVGYNYWMGQRTFVGILADVSFGDIDGFVMDGNYLKYSGKTDVMATLRPRIGFVVTEGFVASVNAGLAVARNKASVSCPAGAPFGVCSFAPAGFTASDTNWSTGWAAGVELEFAAPKLGGAFYLSYLHTDFGKQTNSIKTQLGTFTGVSEQAGDQLRFGFRKPF